MRKLGRFLRVGAIILVLLFLFGLGAYFIYKNNTPKTAENIAPELDIALEENNKEVFINDQIGVQEIIKEEDFPNYISQSEHYASREITFGGYEVDMSGESKNSPLIISDVRGETVISKDGKSTKFLFSWKTNKAATSEVTYAKNDGPTKNTLSEPGPGLVHALILNFEPATRYVYYITAKDRWGNSATSDKFSAYTAIKSDNIVDLIAQQFKQIFSWAVR